MHVWGRANVARKSFGLAIFTTLWLLCETTGSAHAQCNGGCAVEWSGGSIRNLGGLPGSVGSVANAINDGGQAAGYSDLSDGTLRATEWGIDSIINLDGLSGSTSSVASRINDAGQVVGYSVVGGIPTATEWSGGIGGSIINLGGLPGSTGSFADSVNDAGQAVGLV